MLRVVTRMDGSLDDGSSGFENVLIKAHFDCGSCLPSQVEAYETFEDNTTALDGRVNGKLETTNTSLTTFLGWYDVQSKFAFYDPVKVWFVPTDASFVTVEFDFYEVDEWDGGKDCSHVYVNNILLNISSLDTNADEGTICGKHKGVAWKMKSLNRLTQLAFGNFSDQVHHFTALVPSSMA